MKKLGLGLAVFFLFTALMFAAGETEKAAGGAVTLTAPRNRFGRLAAPDPRGLHTPVPFLLATGNWHRLEATPSGALFDKGD
mgnify:CR=1 FL=1